MLLTRDLLDERLGDFEVADVPSAAGGAHAAVCLAVVPGVQPQTSALVVTKRSSRLRNHRGQWALPGGCVDPGETVREAALRELSEEVGISATEQDVVAELDDFVTRSGFRMTPVVVWAGDEPFEPVLSEAEVESVHLLGMDELDVEPRFVTIEESDRPVIQLPVLGTLIHAPTGAVLHQFRELVLHGRVTRVHGFEQPVFAWR